MAVAAGETQSLISNARSWLESFTGSENGDWYLERDLAGFRAFPLLNRALRRMADGDYDGARTAVDRALQIAPQNAAAWTISGDLAYRRGNVATAWHQLNHALALNPDLAQAHLYRAYVRIEYGDFDGARSDFNAALAIGALTDDQIELAQNGLGAAAYQVELMNAAASSNSSLPITNALLQADPNRRPNLPAPGPVSIPRRNETPSQAYVSAYVEPPTPTAGDRAYSYASNGQCAAADPLFMQAYRDTGDGALLIARADCFNSAGDMIAAHAAFEAARRVASGLSVVQEVYVLQSLGYSYENTGDHDRAAEAWGAALALDETPTHRLALARNLMAAGDSAQARQTIASINPDTLSPGEQAAFYDLRGGVRAETNPVGAIPDFEAAVRAEDSADRRYRLATALQAAERHDEALVQLEQAYDLDPSSADIALSLAYAYGNVDRPAASIPYFVEGLRRDDARFFEAREDLAYAQLRTRRYGDAARSFRRVVDNEQRYDQDTRAERRELDQRMYRVRREVSELERTGYAYGSAVYRSTDINASGLTGADRDQSQWSALVGWYPLRGRVSAGRNLSIFARAYQSFEPGGFSLRDETLQAGVGLRLQPFDSFGLTLSGERLIAVGDEARNAWLFSAAHGWGIGGDWRPTDRRWTVASSYLEAAYIPDDPQVLSGFGELFLGQAFAIAPRLAVIPHVVASVRYSEDEFVTNFLSELGVGASLRYWFDDTRYQAPRGSIDFQLQYRWFAYDDTEIPLTDDGAVVGRVTISR